jgi:hypothetical protein
MTNRVKNTSITLTAALALASGAYALGNQAGDGSAVANNSSDTTTTAAPPPPPGPGPHFGRRDRDADLGALAKKLGVSTTALKTALDELRPTDRPGRDGPPPELVKALADGLNLSTDKVTAALEKLRPDRGSRRAERMGRRADRFDGFAAALAKQLGLKSADVSAALKKVAGSGPGDRPGDPRAFAAALAKELGVGSSKLRTALDKVRPNHGPGPGHHGPGPAAAALAKELGVDTADVRKVLDSFRDSMAAQMKTKHDEFVAALAKKLGISESKVRAALPEGPRGGPGFHPHP